VIEAAGGRTFLLCTTLRAVKRAAERLRDEFERRGLNSPCSCRRQGPHGIAGPVPRGRQRRADRQPVFWEGVDVRGDALSLVIIDKLPFAPPDDPVLAARIEVMENRARTVLCTTRCRKPSSI
jgi:ATP-dependent DNA helicase DinG